MIVTSRFEKDTYSYQGKKETRYKTLFVYEKSDGNTEKITKRFRTQTEAKDYLSFLNREHAKKGSTIEHRALLFSDYAETYKRTYLGKLRTAQGERNKIDLMIEFFGDIKLEKLRRAEIKEFKQYLESTSHERTRKIRDKESGEWKFEDASRMRSPRTVNTYLVRLRALLNEAETDEKILSAPSFKGLIDTHLEVKRDLTISYVEFERLLAACDEERSNHDRKHIKIVLMGLFELGCRVEELQKIQVKDIDLDTRIVKIWEGKKKIKKQRLVYIPDRLYVALQENGVMDMPEDARAFGETRYYSRSFATAKKIAGINSKFRLNDIRHTAITNRIEAGMDLVAIQKQVGHSAKSAMTVDTYTNLRPEYIVESSQKVEQYSRKQLQINAVSNAIN